jgi:hypothetical protein
LELDEVSGMLDRIVGGDSTVIERLPDPPVGARSAAVRARLRGMVRLDLQVVTFARGRASVSVVVSAAPNTGDSVAPHPIAEQMDRRIRDTVPGATGAAPAASLVEAVRRVVEAELRVDSVVEAREFDAAIQTVERARLSRAPVSFLSSTWNSLCWSASLYGHAERAMPACEAAVAPDTTNLAVRDSRGLARAMAGNLDGAREDFEYVVARAAAGPFLDRRAAWLEALRQGTNPFTPEVLEELRKQ